MRHRHITSIVSWLIIITMILPMLIINTEAQSERNWEDIYRSLPRAELLKDYVQRLSAEPHHVGSVAGRRNAEWMRDQLNRWGLQATIEEYDILFPTPRERVLELLEPAPNQPIQTY